MAEAKSSKTLVFAAFAVGLALMGGLAYLLTNIKGNKDVSGELHRQVCGDHRGNQ
jgi:hypothetical protein